MHMKHAEVLSRLMLEREISTDMLKTIGMSFEVFLKYAQFSYVARQKIVDKAIKKLAPEYCEVCQCVPCDCSYGSK